MTENELIATDCNCGVAFLGSLGGFKPDYRLITK